ncbi:EAL domain-containing protein [Lysinibacillus yapensis]|uniref:EAL domain-containing protein n=1 Tax=Ureibacillus yapensis TaxID=2304605 RepID=A0A396S908_9BACL|nr:EAL domain-containing protein [Lysinibacillus yapensis]RHW37433.1 EAL domain-containing protein [Lysinibacillus yapensis]
MNPSNKINILLVDDRPENLLALEAIIERDEFNLIKAFSGEEALKYLLKYDFAAILLDVQMPGMDGFSTAKIIKAREKTKNIPILFITANNLDSEHIFMGYSVGAIDYILKPFDPLILKSKVERFVELYQLNQKIVAQSEALEEKNMIIEHMAYHDGLTKLPNRRMFQDVLIQKLAESKTENETLGLMYLDLDRFKTINDSLGHIMGDKILKKVSERFIENVRQTDFVARIGGDEFVIILSKSNREECLEVAEALIDSFNSPIHIDNFEFYLTTSIGLSIFPYDGEDTSTLFKNADAALYRAKEQGKNKYKVYHSGMNMESYRRFLIQNDIRKAIQSEQFTLVFQPKVNLETYQIDSAESLIRWNHPKWGLLKPIEFISLAEETNLILDIDKWVLKKVCEQITYWKETYNKSIRVSVNFSAQHFLQRNLIEQIKEILEDTNVDPTLLEIEVTETVLLRSKDSVKQTLEQLKELNIHISLDDYGKGYSSINYLREFPFDTVKIDKAFIQEITCPQKHSRLIIESTIALMKNLGLNVVAEGVETIEQLNLLKEFKCDEVQGFIFSKPLSTNDFIRYVDKHKQNSSIIDSQWIKNNEKVEILDISEETGINKSLITLSIKKVKMEYSLSTRELDVFSLIVKGLSNKEISEKLFISEHTVKNHITNIFSKLNVSDRVQAIALVYETSINETKVH